MRKIITSLALILSVYSIQGQIGYGLTANIEPYQRYNNPEDGLAGTSAGNLFLNFGLGPKIWVGGNNFSIAFEAVANIGLFGLDLNDFKGLGMASFPLMAHLNFGGTSGLDKEGKFGFTIGGGIQYNKTELFFQSGGSKELGVERDLFPTYIGEVGYGFGMSGFVLNPYIRFGYHPDNSANSFNLGVRFDFNFRKLKEITDPASDL